MSAFSMQLLRKRAVRKPDSQHPTSPRDKFISLEQRVNFERIRYSQSWEDPECLARALQVRPGDTVLSVGASGDNSFALLLHDPAQVVAVDLSAAQCALIELKKAAIRALEHIEMAGFLGALEMRPERRISLYRQQLRPYLSPEAIRFWDAHPDMIRNGVIHSGRLERYFRLFRKTVLRLTHSPKKVTAIFEVRSRSQRLTFYNRIFNNIRWRILMRTFFSKWMIGRLGRDPAFYEHVDIPNVSSYYASRLRHAMVENPVVGNWFLEYILRGRYDDLSSSHPYLRPENHRILRERIDRLEVVCASLESYVETLADDSIDACNLSDIFEWMDESRTEAVLRQLARITSPGRRIAYWNNLVPRSRPASLAHLLEPNSTEAAAVHARDRAFFYRSFVIEEVTGAC